MIRTRQSEAHHHARKQVEAEAVDLEGQQVKVQMFICWVEDLQAQKIAQAGQHLM